MKYLLLICLIFFTGCTEPRPTSQPGIEPKAALFDLHEYILVEQSVDNPDHPEFVELARQAVGGEGYRTWDRPGEGSSSSLDPGLAREKLAMVGGLPGLVGGSSPAAGVEDDLQPGMVNGLIYRQTIGGQEFQIYERAGLVHVNYAGEELPILYDRVVYGQSSELAIFNPGGEDSLAWFYALRDGLWYYVEAGLSR